LNKHKRAAVRCEFRLHVHFRQLLSFAIEAMIEEWSEAVDALIIARDG